MAILHRFVCEIRKHKQNKAVLYIYMLGIRKAVQIINVHVVSVSGLVIKKFVVKN